MKSLNRPIVRAAAGELIGSVHAGLVTTSAPDYSQYSCPDHFPALIVVLCKAVDCRAAVWTHALSDTVRPRSSRTPYTNPAR